MAVRGGHIGLNASSKMPQTIFRGLNWDDFDFSSKVWDHDFKTVEISRSLTDIATKYYSEPCSICGARLQDSIAEYGCIPLVEIIT